MSFAIKGTTKEIKAQLQVMIKLITVKKVG